MIAFLGTTAGRYAIVGLAAVLLAGGAYWYVYHEGQTDERNANTARVLKETEDARKLREANDARARALDDARALECLRNPSGCR